MSLYPTLIHQRVAEAHARINPLVICRLKSCWLVARETQPLEGCCIILSDPVVASLNNLSEAARAQYCADMAHVGDALLEVTGAYRINYETWCNVDQALHTHIIPRFTSEPDDKKLKPAILAYDFSTARKFDPQHDAQFIAQMRKALSPYLASEHL